MDNQLIQSPLRTKRLLTIAVTLVVIIAIGILGIYWHQNSDPYIPYVEEVLPLEGNLVKGHAIFQINCSGCHASQVNGSVGPNLKNVARRKSRIELIEQVVSGRTPPMPKFQPTPQEMADLLSYLQQLN